MFPVFSLNSTLFWLIVLPLWLFAGCGDRTADRENTPALFEKQFELEAINDDRLLIHVAGGVIETDRSDTLAQLRLSANTLPGGLVSTVVGVACVDKENGKYLVFLPKETLMAIRTGLDRGG